MKEMWKKYERLSTGDAHFDDLIFGGIPFSNQVLVSGPSFIGKEIFIDRFIAEGLKVGAPMTVVLMDRSPARQREDLCCFDNEAPKYEKKGLLKFIDAYSRPAQLKNIETGQSIIQIADSPDFPAVLEAVKKADQPYMQVVVRSVSDCLCYSNMSEALRFLRNLTGWAREQNRVGLYDIDRASHSEIEYGSVVRLMDDVLEFYQKDGKNYLKVRARYGAQRSDGVEYTFTRTKLKLGSFAVEHVGKIE